MSVHIMIDLETLGTTADAAILSIGAVAFDIEVGVMGDEPFYAVADLASQSKRVVSTDTLVWWTRQSHEAIKVFVEQPKLPLDKCLQALKEWVERVKDGSLCVWSNGADFDLPMLTHAYQQCGIKPPWPPYAGRCYRTYKNLPSARDIALKRIGMHHNALDDARDQAAHLCLIHQVLFMGAGPSKPVVKGEAA